jgi:hypothetical protein
MSGLRVDDKRIKMSNPLHDARVQRAIPLQAIISSTRLSPRIAKALDEGRFAELPGGLYAREYVRMFARAVRLDPDQTLESLRDQLPDAVELQAIVPDAARARPAAPPQPGRLVRDLAVDVALLLSVSALVVAIVSAYCGLSVRALMRLAPGPIVGLCAPVWVTYEVLLGRVWAHRIFWSGSSFLMPASIGILSVSGVRPAAVMRRVSSALSSASLPDAFASLMRFTRSAGSSFRS